MHTIINLSYFKYLLYTI